MMLVDYLAIISSVTIAGNLAVGVCNIAVQFKKLDDKCIRIKI